MTDEVEKLKADVEFWKDLYTEMADKASKFELAYGAAMRIVKSTYPDKFPNTYFISGQGGEVDKNGLPERLYVCPAYGVDWVEVYKR